MLDRIKKLCGIMPHVTAYNDEIQMLIESAKIELKKAGVDERIINSNNAQLLNAVSCYVKAYRGEDRSNTTRYLKMFNNMCITLTLLDPEEENEDVEYVN